MAKTITTETNETVITFNVEGAGSISIDFAALSDEIREAAMVHGLVQKISDGAALPKGATVEEKLEAMTAIRDRLVDGEWRKAKGDGSGPVAGIIFRAFERFVEEVAKSKKATPPTRDAIRALYDGKTRAEQLALRSIPRVAEIMEEMRATKATSVDTDALLAGLGI